MGRGEGGRHGYGENWGEAKEGKKKGKKEALAMDDLISLPRYGSVAVIASLKLALNCETENLGRYIHKDIFFIYISVTFKSVL